MADALAVISAIQTVQVLAKIVLDYLSAVRDASTERESCRYEVKLVLSSLNFLRRRIQNIQQGDSWSEGLLTLVEPGKRLFPDKTANSDNGSTSTLVDRMGQKVHLDRWLSAKKEPKPKGITYYDANAYEDGAILKRLNDLLAELLKKLEPHDGIKLVGDKLVWFWRKQGVADTIKDIMKLKNHIGDLMQQDQFDLSLADHILNRDTNERIKDVQLTQQEELREKERREIMEWLSPLMYLKRQDAVYRDSFPAEQRLVHSPEFKAWVTGRPWTLWCHGNPGAGKTVLCSEVIHYLEKNYKKTLKEDFLVLYLYLDYKEKNAQTLVNLKGSLVKQLVQHQQFTFRSKELQRMWWASNGEARPQEEELQHVLHEEFRAYSRVFLIVDGWDDASDDIKEGLDNLLTDLCEAPNVSVMITSRSAEVDTAEYQLKCCVCGATPLSIYFQCRDCQVYDVCQDCKDREHSCGNESITELWEPYDRVYILVQATDDEIRRFVTLEIERQKQLGKKRRIDARLNQTSSSAKALSRRLEEKPSLIEEIPDEIVRKAKGMYLLARLYIDSLKTMQSVKEIEHALVSLPESLDTVYERKMDSIINQEPRRNADWAKQTLYWIICTQRPLTLVELQHALGVKVGQTQYDPYETTSEADIISVTRGLVNIDGSDRHTVRVHLTLHQYLRENQAQWCPGAGPDITSTLLTYLNFKELSQPCKNNSDGEINDRLQKLPLLAYASQYWGDHASECYSQPELQPLPEVQNLLLEFLSDTGKVTSCVQMAVFLDPKLNTDLDVRKGVNGLHLAAMYGLDLVIPDLVLVNGASIDSIDEYEQTALMYACRKGHLSTVMKLLDLGASVNVISKRDSTAFLEAYRRDGGNHEKITRLLEKQELEVNLACVDDMYRTPLMMATCWRHLDIVESLLRRTTIQVNLQDQEGHTALSLAVMNGFEDIVKLLLDYPGTEFNTVDTTGRSPLSIAAYDGNVDIVHQLLKKSADASVKDQEGGGTALQRAVDGGHIPIIQAFLNHKHIKTDVVDNHGRGLLHSASINGHDEIVRLLLEAELSPNAKGNQGETPLHDASRAGHFAVAEILLAWQADRIEEDNNERTPRKVAWENGHLQIMHLLDGAESTMEISSGDLVPHANLLPTWSLAKLGLIELIKERLEKDLKILEEKDPDSNDTPLHYAVMRQDPEILHLLLEAHVSPDCVNDLGRTPLHIAVLLEDTDAVKKLLLYHPDLTKQDAWRQTPLKSAQSCGFYYIAVTLIDFLIDTGAKVDDSPRIHLQPTFMAAVRLGNTKVVEYLINKGADHLREENGVTPKQIALLNDDADMLRVLNKHKSVYLPLRTNTQRSEDYISATSSPASTPASTPPATPATPVLNSPSTPSSLTGPDLSKPAFRPRPPIAG